jgi:hypothetical protein
MKPIAARAGWKWVGIGFVSQCRREKGATGLNISNHYDYGKKII